MTSAGVRLAYGDARPPLGASGGSGRSWLRLGGWSVLEALPVFASGVLVSRAVDAFVAGEGADGLGWLGLYGALTIAGVFGIRGVYARLCDIVEPLRDALVSGTVRGSLSRATSAHTSRRSDGADAARLTSQVETVREASAASVMVLQEFVAVTIAALAGLLVLDPMTALVVIPPLVVGLGLFAFALRQMLAEQEVAIIAEEELATLLSRVDDGLRDIVATGAEDVVIADVTVAAARQSRAVRTMGRWTAVASVAAAIGGWGSLLAVLGLGPWLRGQGVSVGVLVGVTTYVLQGLQPALQTLVQGLIGPGASLRVAWRRISSTALLDGVDQHSGGLPAGLGERLPDPAEPELALDEVSFAYGATAARVVDKLTLRLSAGESLAVVGPSGVGKSTLAALMAGLEQPQQGAVRICGMDLSGAPAGRLADLRVLIPQQAYLFAGPLRDNLSYLRPTASDSDLLTAVSLLDVLGVVERLGSLDSVIAPADLSAGEAQLLCLIRAYVAGARLIVLDEATSHLDPATEAHVERCFAAREGALVVIAHRMSSAIRAERVLFMADTGASLGSHSELVATSAAYRDLVGAWQTLSPG